MKNFSHTAILNAFCILLTAGLLFSCSQMEPFEAEEINQLSAKAMSAAPDCDSDCIEPGSGNYFEKSGSLSERSGINTKMVSYTAYNTEDAFIVDVTYRITTGPAKGKASITINIGGVAQEFKDITSGRTVSHSIPLVDGWKGCDEMAFQISQTGMGKPIQFIEKYELVPVCPAKEEIPYVIIGKQEWMQRNLNVSRYRNGDPIPQVQDPIEWANLTTGAWCYYDNDPANGEIYGKLYNWYAVNDPRGLAPEGWEVPTQHDWEELIRYIGGDNHGHKLKSTGDNRYGEGGDGLWWPPNPSTNTTGFSALPGGGRGDGWFSGLTYVSIFWSSTQYFHLPAAFNYMLDYDSPLILQSGYNNFYGFSVRCLKFREKNH